MDKLIVELIRLSIAKGFDIDFNECPDFNDGQTMYVWLSTDEKVLKESDRITMYGDKYDIEIVEELIEWLKTQER